MKLLLGLIALPKLFGFSPVFPKVVVERGSNVSEMLCDVSSIIRDTFQQNSAANGISGARTIVIRVDRLPDLRWNFDVLLRSPLMTKRRTMSWRLQAATCERAARRTGLKLMWVSEALQWARFPERRLRPVGAPSEDDARAPAPAVQVPPSRTGLPPITQRPSVSGKQFLESKMPTEDHDAVMSSKAFPLREIQVRASASVMESAGQEIPVPVNSVHHMSNRRIPVGMGVRFGMRTGSGVLPQAFFVGGQLNAILIAGAARVELGVGVSRAGVLDVPGDGPTRRPLHAGLQMQGCGEVRRHSFDLRLCAVVEGGLIMMKDLAALQRPWTLHIAGAPSLTWWFHRWVGLFVGISVGPALVRSSFYLGPTADNATVRLGMPAVLTASSIGLELRRRVDR